MHPEVWQSFQRLSALRAGAPPLVAVPRAGELPASFQQERLWYIDQASPGGTAYNLPVAFRIQGALDVAALGRAIEEVERRHEALRTNFDSRQGRIVQIVHPPGRVFLAVVDLRRGHEAPTESALAQELSRSAWRPFDLLGEPLFRATLYVLGAETHVLLFDFHHIVYDGWSQDVLFRELSALYDAFHANSPLPVPTLDIQYGDFAVWQRAWLGSDSRDALGRYWRERLSGPLRGPRLGSRAGHADSRGGRRAGASAQAKGRPMGRATLSLPLELSRAVTALSREAGATLFTTLLAAFQVLVHHHAAGQPGFFVCSPIANRHKAALERLIGYFVNLLILRADLAGDPSFEALLARVRSTTAGAYAHQDLPVQLIEDLDLGGEPLSQVLFSFENTPGYRLELSGLAVEKHELQGGSCDFDLFLALHEDDGVIAGTLKYSLDLLDADQAAQLLRDYQAVVAAAVADPARALSSFLADVLPHLVSESESESASNSESESESASDSDSVSGSGSDSVSGLGSEPATNVRDALAQAQPDQRRGILLAYLRAVVARVAGRAYAGAIEGIHSLQDLAIGSLELIELTGRVRAELAIDMPVVRFFEASSLDALAGELCDLWLQAQLTTQLAAGANADNAGDEDDTDQADDGREVFRI